MKRFIIIILFAIASCSGMDPCDQCYDKDYYYEHPYYCDECLQDKEEMNMEKGTTEKDQ